MNEYSLSTSLRRITFSIFLFIVLLSGGFTNFLQAQSFDYNLYPKLDFNFIALELELGIQPQNLRIDGAANYEIEANINGADTLTLNASHLDISSVTVNGEQADFSLHNDSLFVLVSDSSEAGTRYNVNIRYSGRPQFGMLKNANGTVWTSQLPNAQRHWVPIVDNPHVTFETSISIVAPAGYQCWASGRKTGEEAVSVDVMRYRFSSGEIPASSLAFGLGQFNSRTAKYGDKRITVAMEESLADSLNIREILQSAQDNVQQLETELKQNLPYGALNIVVMEDHNWETKAWGASTVYAYTNRGSIDVQVLRGIIGQWFGAGQREERWSQADAVTLYQTLLYQEMADSTVELRSVNQPRTDFATVYDNFGPERWNRWQKSIEQWQTPSLRSRLSSFATDILNELPDVISWRDYAGFWYRRIGQPLFDLPSLSTERKQPADTQTDSVSYKVVYTLNEAEGQLKLRFSSKEGGYADLTTLTTHQVYPGRVDTGEVTFTGAQDSVILQVEPTISTLRIAPSGHPELVLDEYKPASFLLHELQNGDTVAERAEAARKLGYHQDNPDLQLAIQDFMQKELAPEVHAALLSSLADITDGAAGTEEIFFEALQSDNQKIRNAGLMALQNYEENAEVRNRVQSQIRNADTIGAFKRAVKILTAITTAEEFTDFTKTVTRQDSVGRQSIFVIQQLANMGEIEEAVTQAESFITNDYHYEVRSTALKILIQHDHTPADWITRAEKLLDAADPRIRYLVVQGLKNNKNDEVVSFIQDHIQDEFDARVYKSMRTLLDSQG